MKSFTVAILVNNRFGVLNRVTSMFRRRQFNIISLAVSETESPETSRITVRSGGDDVGKQQLINQLYKLPDVLSIKEFDPLESVSREMLLIKVENDAATRTDVTEAVSAYEGKIIDYTKQSIIVQVVGESRKIDNFLDLMRDFKILEVCRTGIVSLERGGATLNENLFI